MHVERVDFVSMPSRDIDRARHFYESVLELPVDRETPGGVEYTCGQVTLGVWEPGKMGLPFAPNPNDIALRVADVAAARAELESKGLKLETPLHHDAALGLDVATLVDPWGTVVELTEGLRPKP